MSDVAKRLAGTEGFRWQRGMTDDRGRTFVEYADCGDAAWLWAADDGCDWLPVAGKAPDLNDWGTIGCIEGQAREVWGGEAADPWPVVTRNGSGWRVAWWSQSPADDHWPDAGRIEADTRGEAWALCLEAGLLRLREKPSDAGGGAP